LAEKSHLARPPRMRPVPVRLPHVVVAPPMRYANPYWRSSNVYFDFSFHPYYPWYYGPGGVVVVRNDQPPVPCKKETLKDSNGKKHDVLVCRQPDGSMKVVADADQLVPADK